MASKNEKIELIETEISMMLALGPGVLGSREEWAKGYVLSALRWIQSDAVPTSHQLCVLGMVTFSACR